MTTDHVDGPVELEKLESLFFKQLFRTQDYRSWYFEDMSDS